MPFFLLNLTESNARYLFQSESYQLNRYHNKMNFKAFAEKIIELKDADLKLRSQLMQSGQLNEGYNEEMEALHNKNAEVLDKIIDKIGYPTIEKVGKEANQAAWLVIQHSIGQPVFMRKCLKLLEDVAREDKSSTIPLAYLSDRIASFENKAQLYGTQFDWDENGRLSPNPYDDLEKVNNRRKSIGLNTLAEQTEIIRNNAKKENHQPPADLEKRKQNYNKWRKKVGWLE